MTTACCGGTFWVYVLICLGLVAFAGCMSGLTLGLMSLSVVDLEVLQKSGTEKDKKYATKILPVVRNQHLLLCTLLIGNALAMEALPIFLDELVPSWGAVLISVTAILIFAEIAPQAICTRYGLSIGSAAAPFVKVLVWLFMPIAYPISMLLDWVLGHKEEGIYRRAELSAFVDMHSRMAGKGGDLTTDETTIITGALEMASKTAEQIMTPIEDTFSLDINTKLDAEILNQMMTKGHSRVPVFCEDPKNIVGLVLVKYLLNVRPEDNLYVRNFIRKIPRVSVSMPLYDMLNDFQKGHSHIAVVVRKREGQDSGVATDGQVDGLGGNRLSTLEDTQADTKPKLAGGRPTHQVGTEREQAMSGGAMNGAVDSFDAMEKGEQSSPPLRSALFPTSSSAPNPRRPNIPPGGNYLKELARSKRTSRIGEAEMQSASGAMSGSPFATSGQSHLSAPVGQSQRGSRRWERTGADSLLDLSTDGPQGKLRLLPEDEEVVGIVTMEDVIEELLQEEILDETDEYISVHSKIRVSDRYLPSLPPETKAAALTPGVQSLSQSGRLLGSVAPGSH